MILNCPHFQQQDCVSCQWLEKPYATQLTDKEIDLKRLISPFILQNFTEILPPVQSSQKQFRNKAKMVVSGSVERPILGILKDQIDPQSGIDLCDCPLYPTEFEAIFPILKDFIARAGLVPYNIAKKKGELKYILLTQSRYNQSVMLRFVLRSEQKRPLVERELPNLLAKLPKDSVVSLNIQPQHAAILEGETEIFLTEKTTIEENFNDIPLFIRPQGFFQTNPNVASRLYATAQNWIKDLPIQQFWDLFCGVGGFGLHCAKALQEKNENVQLTGIEISASAIASATQSAAQLQLKNVTFASLDSAQFALNDKGKSPDLVIVNPPRRGIGKPLAEFLNELGTPYLIYSSCNAQTMAKDFEALSNYSLQKVQLFDMFPHTSHYEVLTFLVKKS
ncbi:23S rRNA (uracil(747)-C(5))-methyltransferase RlmC [Actinobacillus pleuropneumoniae]|uniref:23S rRNA (uracil(747)-C(5))-methyltransferase RlmC n=1 Tax=Actinobacillus pleuropneumoniae serotype 3 (strain JL03) TaxID=434271 RepID=RLMC_ACTPJ|nr:23S rRNA (uracil(747)-C(5))-methyltransferase RlmC [Actinobacillus pleuropneumoniae]B0BQ52.1 RecName: Full=23S rRNA (uracil(747)-C(5))-methyltransferase RlmC; AltName: Full=23S rRNA(m5U747)-methyltransferase [Actinobacillus pleuropneumoniae serovar 3 str. JL03]ABY69687.1 SAM-dependent methyltransferase related to tRNA(uracil-5-)-methyltransferase [Actinobacillus pleuropneumoniae serovar 3 str. JL03]UKH14637.1 23S rRNA (uracil(747)-C(5))-methyltransferase RlmC [Actinobacillus pleuropneumoniae]